MGKALGAGGIFGAILSPLMKPNQPKKPPSPQLADTDGAVARDAERRRLAAGPGSRSTVLSGNAANALGAAIGRQTLGGAL